MILEDFYLLFSFCGLLMSHSVLLLYRCCFCVIGTSFFFGVRGEGLAGLHIFLILFFFFC